MAEQFTARYRGRCLPGHDMIEPGDLIEYTHHQGVLVPTHVECAGLDRPQAPREVCTTCFMEKPCPCEDGQ